MPMIDVFATEGAFNDKHNTSADIVASARAARQGKR
jgi:hypothetical protein